MKLSLMAGLTACALAFCLQPASGQTAFNLSAIEQLRQLGTLIGHASGCGIETRQHEKLVQSWIASAFDDPADQNLAHALLFETRTSEEKRQVAGETLDTCNEVFRLFEKAQWPSQPAQVQAASE